MLPLMAAAVAAPIITGAIGNMASAGDKAKASQMLQNMYAKYAELQIPDTEKMKLALEDFKNAGNLSNQAETTQQLGAHDAMQDAAVDPRLRQAQMDQLQALSRLGDTGVTPGEQAQLNKMQRNVESDNSARLKAMLQQQDQRGVGSSDAALASRMISSQSAANRQAQESDDQAAMIFNRALQAKQAAGSLGGSMEGIQYGEQADLAKSLNARELQNMQERSSSGSRNTDRFNQAQMYNTSNAQNIANQNTGLHNTQQAYNKELLQKEYDNKLKRLAGMSGQTEAVAGNYNDSAKATESMWNNIGGGAGKTLGGAAMNQAAPASPTAQASAQNTINASKNLPSLSMKPQQDDPVNFFGTKKLTY